jgi:hypothetical protein
MTITRRQIMVGAAATVAAGVMPAVKAVGAPDMYYGVKVIKTTIYAPWMPTCFYMVGDKVQARGKTYIATRNKVSAPFFTEHGWRRLEA